MQQFLPRLTMLYSMTCIIQIQIKNAEDLYNHFIAHNSFSYYIPIVLNYDLGIIKPGIGICLFDSFQIISYDGTFTDDFGDENNLERTYKFHHNSIVGGILNLEIQINEVTHIFIDGLKTDGYAANLRFQFDL